jgi:hypothetical protein
MFTHISGMRGTTSTARRIEAEMEGRLVVDLQNGEWGVRLSH